MTNLARHYGVLAACVGLMTGAMGRAEAASITYTAPLTSGTVPLFDPNLGTLLEVDFNATGNGGATIEFLNSPTVSGSYSQFEGFTFLEPGGNSLVVGPFLANTTPFSTTTGLVFASGSFNISTVLDPSAFFILDGHGTFFNPQIDQTFQVSAVTDPFIIQGNFASGTATVTYVYSPIVPEPSSAVLAGIGLASAMGLGYGRRRRRVAP
jgi:hypothetical protein